MLNVRELLGLYLRHSVSEGVHSADALADRRKILGMFADAYGTLLVSECKPFHLTDFIESHPGWRSVSTRRAKANYIRAAFQWATNEERIQRNPFLRVRYAEAERRPELPDDVLDCIARQANKRFEEVVRWLRFTGCRLSELCRALWTDIDFQRGLWTIPKHKTRKFTGKPKIVALVPEAIELLNGMGRSPNFIFLNNHGRPWNRRALGQHLRRMKKRHDITTPATLHGIRHQFACSAVAAGAPIKLVAAQLGHSTVTVTERYYVNLEGQMEAVRAAAAMALPKK